MRGEGSESWRGGSRGERVSESESSIRFERVDDMLRVGGESERGAWGGER